MLGDLKLKNRIVMAPLTRTRAENQGKVPNELMVEYYAQRAGAGLIIAEGTFVSEQGQGWYGAPGIYSDAQRAGWERITDAVHRAGRLIFLQRKRQSNGIYAQGSFRAEVESWWHREGSNAGTEAGRRRIS
jgi:2,4-dienoyl-CoA reductase-like NADH-dependent reductase (Old Yellow Enzyme family)